MGSLIGVNIVINSTDDKIATTKTYWKTFESKRCLIPVNVFYEGNKIVFRKNPYYFKTTDHGICCYNINKENMK